MNLNWIEFAPRTGGGSAGRAPFGGEPASIPGRIEAEAFDFGGQGVAFSDAELLNHGRTFRNESVDIGESGTGFAVNNFVDGEWLRYSVAVADPGTYMLRAAVSSDHYESPGNLRIRLGGTDIATVPGRLTGSWHEWQIAEITGVKIASAGEQTLEIEADGGWMNLDFLEFVRTGDPAPQSYAAYAAALDLPPGADQPGDDADRDGRSNGEEFALGSDASDGASLPDTRVDTVRAAGRDYLRLTFLRRAGGVGTGTNSEVGGVGIEAEGSFDLRAWNASVVTAPVPNGLPDPPAGFEFASVRLAAPVTSGGSGFLRLRLRFVGDPGVE
ncbi:MAG: carbohydrate-binding protein [Verrucomicrobiales bacterium]